MPKTLLRKNPALFKTLPLFVEASPEQLCYQSLATPLNFSQMLERRRPVSVSNPERFALELANLGVSVRLTLHWQRQAFWVVVRQQRPDRGDTVLKLISGYVPTHELALPLLPAIQEVAEECLLETPEGWLGGRFGDLWLGRPYAESLHYREAQHFYLESAQHAKRPVLCGHVPLIQGPEAYVHLPTASLQLVYDMHLNLPREVRQPSLFHVDEQLEEGQLIARLDRSHPNLYLIPLSQGQARDELFTLYRGELRPVSTRNIWLAESFAEREAWVVRAERIGWKEWINHQPSALPKRTELGIGTEQAAPPTP